MLQIEAKENAQINVIEGNFSLGQKSTIKILITDDVLKQYIKSIGTNTCLPEDNQYTYGDFNYFFDIEELNLNLNLYSQVSIVSGFDDNFSRCLECVSNNDNGLGTCILPANRLPGLVVGKEYKLVLYVACQTNTEMYLKFNNTLNDIEDTGSWQQKVYTFVANSTDFNLEVVMPSRGTCYIDSIRLFESDKEVIKNDFDNVYFDLKIKNPIQPNCIADITEIVTYSKPEDEETYIILNFPPINFVDFQDNLLCNLYVYLAQDIKNVYLGNTEYLKEKNTIYASDAFILTGYILPPDIDQYELVIDKI